MKYIVDANVLSETTKPVPDQNVVSWLRLHEQLLLVNPIILGELEFGILSLPIGQKRSRLEKWFLHGVKRFPVLDIDAKTAGCWALLLSSLKKRGLAMPVKDSLVAATALAHGLAVVTRNTKDFRHTEVPLINPFETS